MEELLNISPVDGRYKESTKELAEYFSEYALIKYRVIVEIKWLIKFLGIIDTKLSVEEQNKLNSIIDNFNANEAMQVKEIESTTKHDVKAVEYYIRNKFNELNLEKYSNYIHFACTSEDINNLAYNLMIKDGLEKSFLPNAEKLINNVKEKAKEWKSISMLAHTHGQPASPTTVGKELAVFVYRWNTILKMLKAVKLRGKFSGAVGNFNAHLAAFPTFDWISISKSFIEELGLEYNPLTTQIESHDMISIIFNYIRAFNNITMDFNSDMWLYISMNYFKQAVVKNEVGSSVMPHKVNPINHENSMANIRMANSIFATLSDNLPISRMQRDLSDSSALRNIGSGFGHSLLSMKQTVIGFGKMIVNEEKMLKDLKDNCAVLAEPIQTVLRKNGYINAYEMLKELTRGNSSLTLETFKEFINKLEISNEDKQNLLALSTENYTGIADKLVDFI